MHVTNVVKLDILLKSVITKILMKSKNKEADVKGVEDKVTKFRIALLTHMKMDNLLMKNKEADVKDAEDKVIKFRIALLTLRKMDNY